MLQRQAKVKHITTQSYNDLKQILKQNLGEQCTNETLALKEPYFAIAHDLLIICNFNSLSLNNTEIEIIKGNYIDLGPRLNCIIVDDKKKREMKFYRRIF